MHIGQTERTHHQASTWNENRRGEAPLLVRELPHKARRRPCTVRCSRATCWRTRIVPRFFLRPVHCDFHASEPYEMQPVHRTSTCASAIPGIGCIGSANCGVRCCRGARAVAGRIIVTVWHQGHDQRLHALVGVMSSLRVSADVAPINTNTNSAAGSLASNSRSTTWRMITRRGSNFEVLCNWRYPWSCCASVYVDVACAGSIDLDWPVGQACCRAVV